jgi:hypothetical protein
MIRSALALCAGLAAAFLTGVAAAADCAFDHVTMLPPRFNPTAANATPVSAGPIPPRVRADLTAAFNLAPPFFQRQLCGLDGVFIAPKGQDSWGYRNIQDGKRYLALSMTLWNNGRPPSFSAYEDQVAQRLLHGWNGLKHLRKASADDAPEITVLAALAHEFGHILFYDIFVNPRGSAPNYSAFCDGTFFSQSWQALPNLAITWRSYGDVVGAHKIGDVQIQEILNALPKHRLALHLGPGPLLRRLLGLVGAGPDNLGGRWASLFAAFSPDEDFVETFKLFVLRNSKAPLQSLELRIPVEGAIVTEDIPGQCRQRPVLMAKLSCFAKTLCAGATADPCGVVCQDPH